jgi:hypothetical protein
MSSLVAGCASALGLSFVKSTGNEETADLAAGFVKDDEHAAPPAALATRIGVDLARPSSRCYCAAAAVSAGKGRWMSKRAPALGSLLATAQKMP